MSRFFGLLCSCSDACRTYTTHLHSDVLYKQAGITSPADRERLIRDYGDYAASVFARSNSAPKLLHPQHCYYEQEVTHVAKYELAETAVDVLARRLRLAFVDRCVLLA